MNIEELKKEYKRAKDSCGNFSEHMKLNELLLSDNSPEVCNYHYELLRLRDSEELYFDIRASFMERPNIEQFLLEKVKVETDEGMLADILQILGSIRSPYAANLAHEFLRFGNKHQQKVASFVLGWVGSESDIAILNTHLLNGSSLHLRITAASAHRQIYFRLPELKDKLLASLKQGFEKEKDDEVIAWIIVMIESIAVKRFGLREDKEDPYVIHGDVQKAKVKAAKFLSEL